MSAENKPPRTLASPVSAGGPPRQRPGTGRPRFRPAAPEPPVPAQAPEPERSAARPWPAAFSKSGTCPPVCLSARLPQADTPRPRRPRPRSHPAPGWRPGRGGCERPDAPVREVPAGGRRTERLTALGRATGLRRPTPALTESPPSLATASPQRSFWVPWPSVRESSLSNATKHQCACARVCARAARGRRNTRRLVVLCPRAPGWRLTGAAGPLRVLVKRHSGLGGLQSRSEGWQCAAAAKCKLYRKIQCMFSS